MLQGHTCVSVHCDQCGDSLGAPEYEAHYRSEDAALDAALAAGWRHSPQGHRWYCSACGPVLTCEAQGHEFTPWRAVLVCQDELGRDELDEPLTGTSAAQRPAPVEWPALPAGAPPRTTTAQGPLPGSREYRYCRRCCLFDSRHRAVSIGARSGSGTPHQTRHPFVATAAVGGGVGEVA